MLEVLMRALLVQNNVNKNLLRNNIKTYLHNFCFFQRYYCVRQVYKSGLTNFTIQKFLF